MTTLVNGRARAVSLQEMDTGLARESSRALAHLVRDDGTPCKLSFKDMETGQQVETTVPGTAIRIFAEVLATMAEGNPVILIPHHAELSTQQAADLMGVSRPYFVKLLDEGKIPCRKVGNQRRVRYSDLESHMIEYKKAASSALDEMTAEAQRLGLYE